MQVVVFHTLVIAFCFVTSTTQHTIDMGTCSCSCSKDGSRSLSGAQTDRVVAGPPGKQGPVGEAGPPGLTGEPGPPGKGLQSVVGTAMNPAKSCSQLFIGGKRLNGVYYIKPSQFSEAIQVYCDFTRKGWTLVASVHENNIMGKCTTGDKWSSEQGNVTTDESSAWENLGTFGSLDSITSADYKNAAYFNLPSRNIMTWFVPNETPLSNLSAVATHKLWTTNDFLNSTLQHLFAKQFPLTKMEGKSSRNIEAFISAVRNDAAAISGRIPNFKNYQYDCSNKQCIQDGSGDMYDEGNIIKYAINNEAWSERLTYDEVYSNGNGVDIKTWAGHPFVLLAWISNAQQQIQFFKLEVTSNMGADGQGSVVTYDSRIVYRHFTVNYKANIIYGASDPSCAQTFFYITSSTWSSTGPSRVSTPIWQTADTQNLNEQYVVHGPMENILVGYILLAKNDDVLITQSEIEGALSQVADALGNMNVGGESASCSNSENSLQVPVESVDNDDLASIMNVIPQGVPPGEYQPGFFHFRPYSRDGIPRAFCPGVRSVGCNPAKMCLGGINTHNFDRPAECGDFGLVSGRSLYGSMLIFYGP